MSPDSRNNKIDYVEFPASPGEPFAVVKRFYQEAFGWKYQDWGDEYSDTKDSGISSGFSVAEAHRPEKPLVVLYATQLEDVREKVVQAGGTIAKDIVAFPGGRRFEFVDPAGNRLGVWSDK